MNPALRPSPSRRLLAVAMLVLSSLVAAPAAGNELVLEQSRNYVIPVQVNGVTLRLRVDPAASGLVILNPDAVRRARIRPGIAPEIPGIPGLQPAQAHARVGPVRLTGRARETTATIDGQEIPLEFIWFDRDAVEGADGLISVAHLPYSRVVFRLAPSAGDETRATVRLDYSRALGLYRSYPVGGRAVAVLFSLWRHDNIGTAAAGSLLAGALGGAWRGEPASRPMSFGIVRPVRPMSVAAPIELDGLLVRDFLVRTGDYRGGLALPEDLSDHDPDEIVVTAASENRQPARLSLMLGTGQFSGCSSIAYDVKERSLEFRCAPAAGISPRPPAAPDAPSAPTAVRTGPEQPDPRLPPR